MKKDENWSDNKEMPCIKKKIVKIYKIYLFLFVCLYVFGRRNLFQGRFDYLLHKESKTTSSSFSDEEHLYNLPLPSPPHLKVRNSWSMQHDPNGLLVIECKTTVQINYAFKYSFRLLLPFFIPSGLGRSLQSLR